MKLLISDYDMGYCFSACSYVPLIGWKLFHDSELDMIRKEYFGHEPKDFVHFVFAKFLECEEVIICENGSIEVFSPDEYSLPKKVEI